MTAISMTEHEILSQPAVWTEALGLGSDVPAFGRPGESVLILGCGTSAFIAESIAMLRESAGQGITDAAYASEWTPLRAYDRVVVISRSGTTSEVRQALAQVPAGTATSAVVGVAGTPVAEAVDDALVLDFADERSVVQTRFPTTVLLMARRAFGETLGSVPAQGRELLALPVAADVGAFSHFVFLGRGWTHGLAQEAALKVREAAQAWSESYPALDYRHGPIAVAGASSLVTVFGALDEALVADVRRTGAEILHEDADPVVQLARAQQLALALAAHRGLDPDAPRHLTRSVVLH
ncbi:MAG: SIS domain-containing protein [Microbacterium sp.]